MNLAGLPGFGGECQCHNGRRRRMRGDLRRLLRLEWQLHARERRYVVRIARVVVRRLHGDEPVLSERRVRNPVGVVERKLVGLIERELVRVVERKLVGRRRQLQRAHVPHRLLSGRYLHEVRYHDVRDVRRLVQGLLGDRADVQSRKLLRESSRRRRQALRSSQA